MEAIETVGVRAAAEALGVAPSTISRQIAAGKIPNHAEDGEPPRVNIDEARAARLLNLDHTKRPGGAGMDAEDEAAADPVAALDREIAGEETEAPAAGDAPAAENSDGARRAPAVDPKWREHRTEREGYTAALARLEYEKRAGLLIERAEVDGMLIELGRVLRDAWLHQGEKLAVELANNPDPAVIAKIINDANRALLEKLVIDMHQKAQAQP